MANTVRGNVEKPADESVDLWIREIKTHGEICWKLIWIMSMFDMIRHEKGSKAGYISLYIKHYNCCSKT